eukprot:54684_1
MAFARNFVNISFEVKFLLFSWPGYEPSSKTKRKKLSMDRWYIISMENVLSNNMRICEFKSQVYGLYLVLEVLRTFGIFKVDQLVRNSMNICHVFLGIQKPYYYKFLCVNSEGKITTSSGGTKGIYRKHSKGGKGTRSEGNIGYSEHKATSSEGRTRRIKGKETI